MSSTLPYQSAFDSLPIGIYFISPEADPVILAVNNAFLEATSRTRDELLGKRLFEVFPESPDDPRGVAALRRSIQTVLDTRRSHTLPAQHFPIPITLPDGTKRFEERYWNAVNTPIFDSHGQLICVSHITIDVTKQTLAETALRQSEERFRSLVTATSDVVWFADADGEISPSPSWHAFTGQANEASKDKGWVHAIHPKDRQHALSAWEKCLEERCSYEAEMRVRRFDGQYRCMNVHAVPILNADGSVREWVGANRDITDTRQAEEQARESAERVRLATDAANLGIWVWNLDDDHVQWENQRLYDMFGMPPWQRPLTVRDFLNEFIHPDDRAAYEEAILCTASTGKPLQYEGRFYRQNDRALRWFEFTALLHYDEEGKPARVIGTAADITDKKHVGEELRIANERLNMAMEGAGEGVWEWNFNESERYYSPQIKEILGYEDGEMPEGVAHWHSLIHPDDKPRVEAAFLDYLGDDMSDVYTCEYRVRTKNGNWKWVLSRGRIVSHDANGKPMRMVGMLSDISQRKETDERIWQLANYDPLTGLPNRRLFKDRLRQEVINAQRKSHALALFFIDLDRFKEVNDLSGHDVGDMLLVQAAHRLKDLVRDSDTVARLGGDEFTIILPDLHNVDHVEQIAQKVLDALAEPFSINEEKVYVSGSVGIAIYPEDAASPEELISKADQAMYAAKHAGKNQFSYFTKEMDEKAHRRLRLIRELHHAVHSGQMKVYYQPVVDLHDGQIIKAEALVRWDHPTFGKVDPSYFIPLAEEGGMIDAIGNYVFHEAAQTAHRWDSKLGKPLQISINKSPLQFSAKRQDQWLQHLRLLGLSPSCVAIEITEGALLHASDNVSNTLLEYRDAGIQVAIDDFGTGYSSMAYLQRLDIDYLKIDQSFTRDMTTNKGNRTIVESMVAMAHKLGLKVIAEGVETKEQVALLQELDCDYGQGYLFSKPLPQEDFEALLMSDKPAFSGMTLH
jgi:diguanylate cyclase (GGDEF)-like protein/PAS domain S-box-containing protein